MGKHVVFHIEERSRVKVVDYAPAHGEKLKIEQSKIEETLRDRQINVRLDSFVDQSIIRRVKGVLTELYAEKGYSDAVVSTTLTELPSGPKLVQLTFTIDEGPKVKIKVVFDGNKAFSDGKAARPDEGTRPAASLVHHGQHQLRAGQDGGRRTSHGVLPEQGYARRRRLPSGETIDSRDGKTRNVRLRIPVDEGERYKIGAFNIADNTLVRSEFLKPLFKVQEGEWYSAKKIKKGLQEVQKVYGSAGFYQFTPNVEACPRGMDCQTMEPKPGQEQLPIVDVTVRMVEGKRFFVNRLTFSGNTTTRDNVVRREMRVYEGGVFNSEGLKESIRRLNQLGYFKPIEGTGEVIQIKPVPGADDRIDLGIKVEEQNRNQLSFGAGVSQFDGFFGQLSFQTSNFLGRGETVGVSLQRGSQARQYQLSFSEPYLWDRPITFGAAVFSRQVRYPLVYSQESRGMNTVVGYPLADYTRLFVGQLREGSRIDLAACVSAYRARRNLRCARAHRPERAADGEQGHERRLQHGQPPDLPDQRPELTAGWSWRASAARPRSSRREATRSGTSPSRTGCRLVSTARRSTSCRAARPRRCRSSRSSSRAASTASAASTCGPSARATRFPTS
jgi:outer membrane protein insertion porin family